MNEATNLNNTKGIKTLLIYAQSTNITSSQLLTVPILDLLLLLQTYWEDVDVFLMS